MRDNERTRYYHILVLPREQKDFVIKVPKGVDFCDERLRDALNEGMNGFGYVKVSHKQWNSETDATLREGLLHWENDCPVCGYDYECDETKRRLLWKKHYKNEKGTK